MVFIKVTTWLGEDIVQAIMEEEDIDSFLNQIVQKHGHFIKAYKYNMLRPIGWAGQWIIDESTKERITKIYTSCPKSN